MPKNSYERHDGTPTLRRLTKLLSGALDDGVRADPDRRRKQVFDAFFDVVKSDETYVREMCRFWFEQAYTDLKKQVRLKKKQAEPRSLEMISRRR